MPGASRQPFITIICKKCQKRLRAPMAAAGKRGMCAKCGHLFVIPQVGKAASPAVAPASPKAPADDQEMVTVPVDVVLRSGVVSGSIVVAVAVLVAIGVISYMVFLRN